MYYKNSLSKKIPKEHLDKAKPYDESLGPLLFDKTRNEIIYPYVKIKYSKVIRKKGNMDDRNSPILQLLLYLVAKLKEDKLYVHMDDYKYSEFNFNQCDLVMSKNTEKKWLKTEYKWEIKRGSKKFYTTRHIKNRVFSWVWNMPRVLNNRIPLDVIYIPHKAYEPMSQEEMVYEL